MGIDINKFKEEGFKPVTTGWDSLVEDDLHEKGDLIHKTIESIKGISKNEKAVLMRLSWEHHVGNYWSVGYGDTQYVMDATGLPRKKADALIMIVLNKLDRKYGYK